MVKGSDMTCPVCGAENEANAAFCYRCGSALKAETPAVTGPTVSLRGRETPAYGNQAVSADADAGARVYDVPASPSAAPASATPPAMAAAPYTTPQYMNPGTGSSTPAPYSAPYGAPTMPQQSSTALIALILGIVSFIGPSIFTAIPAVILGRNARRDIQASNGQLTGDGMAQAGVILGWINIGLTVLLFCAICVVPFLLAAAGSR